MEIPNSLEISSYFLLSLKSATLKRD
jgi:hypothetical protein